MTTTTVNRLYGERIRRYFDEVLLGPRPTICVLQVRERNKSIKQVLKVCEDACRLNLERGGRILALGGGICADICGLAATLYRRGIAYVKVPTTLVGIVDAGIAAKNAVNFLGSKSILGTFTPPYCSLLDCGFLATLPRRHILCGVAEILKMAIASDVTLYRLLERDGPTLIDTAFSHPAEYADEVIRRAVLGMLRELSSNPFEVSGYERAVDFGHTFSPHIETASGHSLLHGEAVAIDIAISSQLAQVMGCLETEELKSILVNMRRLSLPTYWSGIDPEGMWKSLATVAAHRGGKVNLVIPSCIGKHQFVPDLAEVGFRGFAAALRNLKRDNDRS